MTEPVQSTYRHYLRRRKQTMHVTPRIAVHVVSIATRLSGQAEGFCGAGSSDMAAKSISFSHTS